MKKIKKTQWTIYFPNTPPNEETLVYYWKDDRYFKITKTKETVRFYMWDGFSESFSDVFVSPIIINLSKDLTL
jgi:hypothetical protein